MSILECHSQGDKRFSAFYACLDDERSIEETYQGAKRDADGLPYANMHAAKGKRPTYLCIAGKLEPCTPALRHNFYTSLWLQYFRRFPHRYTVACGYTAFRDRFAHNGRVYTIGDDGQVAGMDASLGCNQAMSIAWLVSRHYVL